MSTLGKIIVYVSFGLLALLIISGIAAFWIPFSEAARIVFGSVLIFFVPGLPWTYVLFNRVDRLERFLASIAFSIIFTPLAMYVVSKLGTKPSAPSILLEVLGITSMGIIILVIKDYRRKKYV